MKKFISLCFFFVGSRLFAVAPVPHTIPVSFSFEIAGTGSGLMTVSAEPGDSVAQTTVSAWTESSAKVAWMKPGKSYDLNFQGNGPFDFSISLIAPEGYTVFINGHPADMQIEHPGGGTYSYDYTVEVRANTARADAGKFSGISIGKSIAWDVGLGGLFNGRSAGRLGFREPDLVTNAPANKARLFYSAPASIGQITVIPDPSSGNPPEQIMTPQTFVNVTDLTGTPDDGYLVSFYLPSQATLSGSSYSVSGSAWKTIRVETPGTNQLKITDTEGSVSHVSLLTLSTTGGGTLATGGTVTQSGGYSIHTFTGNGTFTPTASLSVDAVIVAGGGGGATEHAGGGGAGGVVVSNGISVSATGYSIVVGAGGSGNTGYNSFGNGFSGEAGYNSSAFGSTAYGGGEGASYGNTGGSGGSGGGAGYWDPTLGGNGTSGQGYDGNKASTGSILNGGGGGGAGSAANVSDGGTPASTWAGTFGGGGGGGYIGGASGGATAGAGGSGSAVGGNASNNTGSGGGGGGNLTANGGNGGSGIVVIRYPSSPLISTYTLQEGDGTTWVRTVTQESTPYSGYREVIEQVRTGGTSGTVVSKTKYRYEDPGWGEELVEVVADPDTTALTTTYTYHTLSYELGNYRRVKSITTPTGNWTSYRYSDSLVDRGQLTAESHPWVDSPGTYQVAAQSVGHTFTYDYSADYSGRQRQIYHAKEWVNNQQVGQSIRSHGSVTRNGLPSATHVSDAYRDGSNYQETTTQNHSGDGSNPDYIGQPLTAQRPDQSQDSYTLQYGTFSSGSFSTSGSSHLRETVWHGSTAYVSGGYLDTYDGLALTPIYLVSGRSTKDVTIRDRAGLVVRTETWICSSGTSFTLLNYEDFSYDGAGRLTQRVASNGATTDYTYTNGQLTNTLGVDGTSTTFHYDLIGRLDWSRVDHTTVSGYTLPGDIYTYSVYDGANRVRKTIVSAATSVPSSPGALDLVTTVDYDLAGKLTASAVPGSYSTSYAYSSSGKVVTATLPGGATKVTETYLDGQYKQTSGTAVVGNYCSYTIESGTGRKFQQCNPNFSSTMWINSYFDWLGRKVEESTPAWSSGSMTRSWYYNSSGQLYKFSQPGMADTLYAYNSALGYMTLEGLDLNANGTLDAASDDRITLHDWSIYPSGGNWWRQTVTYTYPTAGSGTGVYTNWTDEQITGFSGGVQQRHYLHDVFGNVTEQRTTIDRTNKKITATTDVPDSSTDAVQISYNGLVVSAQDQAGVLMKYGYDAIGRQNLVIDPRTSTTRTTTAFKSGSSEVDTITDGNSKVQATYTYDGAGRVSSMKNVLNKYVYYDYYTTNQKKREWGDTVNPVELAYDGWGRLTTMKAYRGGGSWASSTWNSSPGTPDWTLWVFDEATGLLKEKYDAANLNSSGAPISGAKKVAYTYNAAGQIKTRTWARGSVTTYYYFGEGSGEPVTAELRKVDYTDSSMTDLEYTYNRLGKVATVIDATGTHTRNYNLSGTLEQTSEDLPTSYFNSRRITYGYDTGTGVIGRPNALKLGTSGSPTADQNITYGYDTGTGRFNSFGGGGETFAYTYVASSNLVEEIENTAQHYNDKRTYDPYHDWVDQRETKWGSTPVSKAKFEYGQDDMGRITAVTKTGEFYDRYGNGTQGLLTGYGYNDRSELTGDITYLASSGFTPLTGRSDSYAYDNMGNRTSVTHNGTSLSYTPNALNQYDSIAMARTFDVAGRAPGSTVTISLHPGGGSSTTASRHGDYFFKPYGLASALSSGSGAGYSILDIVDNTTPTPFSTTTDGFVAATPLSLTGGGYDDDGNMLKDGRWNYTYDAENRLLTAETNSASVTAGVTRQKLTFVYDYLGRRVSKVVQTNWSGSSYGTTALSLRYIYNGWNLMAELDHLASDAVVRSYYWGMDIMGPGQRAGGIGGLLMIQGAFYNAETSSTNSGKTLLAVYDGMGNLHGLLNTASVSGAGGSTYAAGSFVAAYEYDGFGQTLRESGPYAATNPFRYATKHADIETGLVYFGFRFYCPSLGRFICRDPREEDGGRNLYAYLHNNSINEYDYLGWETSQEYLDSMNHADGYDIDVLGLPGFWSAGSYTNDNSRASGTDLVSLLASLFGGGGTGPAGSGWNTSGNGVGFVRIPESGFKILEWNYNGPLDRVAFPTEPSAPSIRDFWGNITPAQVTALATGQTPAPNNATTTPPGLSTLQTAIDGATENLSVKGGLDVADILGVSVNGSTPIRRPGGEVMVDGIVGGGASAYVGVEQSFPRAGAPPSNFSISAQGGLGAMLGLSIEGNVRTADGVLGFKTLEFRYTGFKLFFGVGAGLSGKIDPGVARKLYGVGVDKDGNRTRYRFGNEVP